MRLTILLFAILTFTSMLGQSNSARILIFQKSEYIGTEVSHISYDTIKGFTGKIDIYFYRKHFLKPYHLPAKFIDSAYRDTTISVWSDINGPKDFMNREFTTTYDRSSRVISFSFSSCFYCNESAYNCSVKYDSHGRVIAISETLSKDGVFRCNYNSTGDMDRLDYIVLDKLSASIQLVQVLW